MELSFTNKGWPPNIQMDGKSRLKLWIVVLCIVTPCSLVGGYQRFGGKYHLHLKMEDVIVVFNFVDAPKQKMN
jgi:hypothetical protein